MDSIGLGGNGWGGAPGERPPNMLASIQSYLNRTQELMQNPTVLLPSLPDPPAAGSILLSLLAAKHCVASIHCAGDQQNLIFSAFLLNLHIITLSGCLLQCLIHSWYFWMLQEYKVVPYV